MRPTVTEIQGFIEKYGASAVQIRPDGAVVLGEEPPTEKAIKRQAACNALRDRIEGLAVGVGTSDRALNLFGRPHVIFANGERKEEGAPCAPWRGTKAMIEATFEAVKAFRDERFPKARWWLIWRCYPMIDDDSADLPVLYLRLSFEPEREGIPA
jgi:hypothetical protein